MLIYQLTHLAIKNNFRYIKFKNTFIIINKNKKNTTQIKRIQINQWKNISKDKDLIMMNI